MSNMIVKLFEVKTLREGGIKLAIKTIQKEK